MAITIFNPQNRPISSDHLASIDKWQSKLDLVLSIGGDGTILGAANKYDLPILPIKSSSNCLRCSEIIDLNVVFDLIISHQLIPTSFLKLSSQINNQQIEVLNEFNLHTQNPQSAIRFIFQIDHQPFSEEIISDGIVIATPFGSTGYFRSITQTIFQEGIGLGFNNPTKPQVNQIIKDNSTITIKITRGPALFCGDNHFQAIIEKDQEITIAKSCKTANIYLS